MKRLVRAFLLYISLSTTIFCQTIDEFSSTVAFLSQTYPNDTIKFGTGFFVATEKSLYLITAQHVSTFLTINSNVTIRKEHDIPLKLELSQLVSEGKLTWYFHEEGDIAILKLSPKEDIFPNLKGHFLKLSHIYSKKESISREITITVLGFPLMLGTEELFSPISKETKPASGFMKLLRPDTKKLATFFITQDPSVGGFSGGPVFDMGLPVQSTATLIIRETNPQVIGLVSGTLSDDTGGKLGAVVPSYQIFELILNIDK